MRIPGRLLRACLLALLAVMLVGHAAGAFAALASDQASFAAQHVPTVDRQVEGDPAADGEDTKVAVQVWTIMAAGGACAAFLLLFLLRVGVGRGPKAPPPQEDAHH
jgi:hypothetical protein